MTPRRWLMEKKYNRYKRLDRNPGYNQHVSTFILLYEHLLETEKDMKDIDAERKEIS